MWKWLQRLWRRWQTDKSEKAFRPPLSAPYGQTPQVLTKNLYPRDRGERPHGEGEKRRPFRFPVIPDEPRARPPKETEASVPPTPFEAYRQSRQEERVHRTPAASPGAAAAGESGGKKEPFAPSEFVSPVYGKMADLSETEAIRTALRNAAGVPGGTAAALDAGEEADLTDCAIGDRWDAGETGFGELAAAGADAMADETTEAATAGSLDGSEAAEGAREPGEGGLAADGDTGLSDAGHRFAADGGPAQPESAPPALLDEERAGAGNGRQADEGVPASGAVSYERESASGADAADGDTGLSDAGHRYGGLPAASYQIPPLSLLNPSPAPPPDDESHTLEQKRLLEETLANFHVSAQVVGIVKGPTVTRFEVQPAPGVKVNKITSLADDIKLNLAAKDIRIEAPIPGKNAVGIEVPNRTGTPIFISRIIGSEVFRRHPSPLAVALGMDIGGQPIVADIRKMPHGLIAGATGSGKSVCINSIIVSLLYKASPEQVRLLLIDPKMVELAPYNHLPHLVTPVVTDAKQATAALKWAVEEMERRYALFVEAGVRDVERYNQVASDSLPYVVIIIDELADLMMVAPQDVEDSIIRIAQKARACGIHLLLATQRPSVDVITGNIKANVPTRLAFAVFSQVDSRTILDMSGAERLLGRGDMLFLESGAAPIRLQGNYVSDDEIERVTAMIRRQRKPDYLFTREDLEQSLQSWDMGDDPLFHEALVFVAEQGQASASALQRRFRIGYNRAARLIEMMEAEGYVAGQSGGKPRAVLITAEDARALAEGTALL